MKINAYVKIILCILYLHLPVKGECETSRTGVIQHLCIFAVYIDSYVITLGLWAKYDIDGHYFRFAARILANPQKKFQNQIVPVFIPITINISSVFISELVDCIQLTR